MKNRREAILSTVGVGAAAAFGVEGATQGRPPESEHNPSKDRRNVIAAGFTEKEADCWEYAAQCAGAFFELPELHPMDKQEVATAIHVIQNKLLSRPTYRKYRAAVVG